MRITNDLKKNFKLEKVIPFRKSNVNPIGLQVCNILPHVTTSVAILSTHTLSGNHATQQAAESSNVRG